MSVAARITTVITNMGCGLQASAVQTLYLPQSPERQGSGIQQPEDTGEIRKKTSSQARIPEDGWR
jgi:hypothetical protein